MCVCVCARKCLVCSMKRWTLITMVASEEKEINHDKDMVKQSFSLISNVLIFTKSWYPCCLIENIICFPYLLFLFSSL